ncbi:Gfo/Idh/MocA family oxidoreductase [Desulfonatronum thiodismutans]|uniref:Gfo/Idh/MocA family oxidoreductase n=1 Tax=Desulfonatronum thiodismutans TaxID=159290 RepID=UPI000A9B8282|nr:Gfo/Idh/MocA family oxidoreductase [Desulfonatronum thiodismutans]
MPPKKNIAVIGSGYWGKNLVRNFHGLGVLGMICERDETLLSTFRSSYPDVQTCLAASQVFANPDIEAVAVATPAETHYALVREALLFGKHVYVEKPFVLEQAHGQELISLAEQKGLVLMVGHMLQYHPVFVRLREMVAHGDLGKIDYIYSHRLNLGKIRREENILWSFAPHDISMILALAGEAPERILATGGNYLHQRIADVTTTHLDFPSGLKAHVFVSWLHPFKEQKLVVVGQKAMAVFDDTRAWPDKLLIYPHEIRWENGAPVPSRAEPVRCEAPEAEPLKEQCRHFVECVEQGCVPRTDGQEGLSVLRVLNAAQWSLEHGGRPAILEASSSLQPSQTASQDRSHRLVYQAHETAVIDPGADIGVGSKIWHFSHILSGTTIGNDCTIGQNAMVGPDVRIGNKCKIQNNVSVYKGVTLEDGVFCGPSMVFTNVFNPRALIRKMDQVRPTLVKTGATLGANCTIICGATIGRYALVAAGAVVTEDVPDFALVMGVPARQAGWVSRHGERLDLPVAGDGEAMCPATGEKYLLQGSVLVCNDDSNEI